MENLANLTEENIHNGALRHILAGAGISDVEEYVQSFHKEVEALIVEDFKNPNANETDFNESIIPPADIQDWVTHLQLRLDDDPAKISTLQHQEAHKNQPKGLHSFMQPIVSTDAMVHTEPATSNINHSYAVTGNMGDWLIGWSKSLTERPPPKSLNDWLNGLVPKDMNELTVTATTSKSRLNTYLNAAEKILARHGYDVSSTATHENIDQAKVGTFGNVKHMYFLWKTLDKNNDGKITVEDVQIMLQEAGLGFLSKFIAKALFDMVDSNHDGQLEFRDFIALMGIIKQLVSTVGVK